MKKYIVLALVVLALAACSTFDWSKSFNNPHPYKVVATATFDWSKSFNNPHPYKCLP